MKIWRILNLSALGAAFVLYIFAMRGKFFGHPSHRVFLLVIAVVTLFGVSNTLWRIARDRKYKASHKTEVELNGR